MSGGSIVDARGEALKGYAICSVGRSGSSWFGELLRSTGVLGDPREFFNTRYQRRLYGGDYPADRHAQLRLVVTEGATANGVYGLKVFPVHLDGVVDRVSWTGPLPNLHFVHWRRRDLLGQALSRHRALQTFQWRSTLAADVVPRYDGQAIADDMRWILSQDARWELFFARNGLAPLRLVYEDVMEAVQPSVDRVADLVGLEAQARVDPSLVDLAIQRDDVTDDWRARFLAEYGDLDELDVL